MPRLIGARLLALLCLVATPLFAAETKAPALPPRPALIAPALAAPARPANPVEALPSDSPAARLDWAKQALDQIEAIVGNEATTDAELARQRVALDPVNAQLQNVTTEITPKLAALKARIDQLGAPPDLKANPTAAPEDPAVTQERADQQKLAAAADDLLKRAGLLQVRADQNANLIAERRRALFANAVFHSASSIVAPSLWLDVVRETPHALAAAQAVAGDYLRHMGYALTEHDAFLFVASCIVLLAALAGAILIARRVIPREPGQHDPSVLQQIAAALWSGLAIAAIPIGFTAALFALGSSFDLAVDMLHPLAVAVFGGVVRCALAAGMVAAILAPKRAYWRPVELGDMTARRLSRLVLTLAVLTSAGKIIEAVNEIIGGSLNASVAARGAFSLMCGLALLRGLYGIVAPEDGEENPGHLDDESPFWAPIRFVAWAATFGIIGAALTGYVALSAFIVDQIAWAAFIGGLLFLLLKLADAGAEAAFRPGSHISRSLMASVGLRRESLQQLAVLLSGAAHVALWAMAALLVLAPLGVQSHDMIGAAEAAFFGFKVGDVTISPSSVIMALLFFGFGYGLTRAFQSWLEKSYLPLTQLDQGLRASIRTSIGYIGVLLSIGFSVAYLGLNFEKLALVAGALSVGIGLGLQSVVNNFVSGLILLWEQAIRVGDWVVIGEEQGYVRRINVRSTEIETFDRATMIVPNGDMVTSVVKNFVRSDRMGRIKIPVQVIWGTDPEAVREALLDVAKSHDEVVGFPAPAVLFVNLSQTALEFELVCFVEDVERALRIKSDLHFAIFSRFKQAGLRMQGTAQAVALEMDKIEPLLARYFPSVPAADIKT